MRRRGAQEYEGAIPALRGQEQDKPLGLKTPLVLSTLRHTISVNVPQR
jgi:hypothetical protein